MSLPISPVTALNAAKAARDVAGTLIKQLSPGPINFDQFLRPESASESPPDVENSAAAEVDLAEQIVDRIRQQLAAAGIPVNPPISFSVSQQGKLRVDGGHERAAEIEAVLSRDQELSGWTGQFGVAQREVAGPARLTVGDELGRRLDGFGPSGHH